MVETVKENTNDSTVSDNIPSLFRRIFEDNNDESSVDFLDSVWDRMMRNDQCSINSIDILNAGDKQHTPCRLNVGNESDLTEDKNGGNLIKGDNDVGCFEEDVSKKQ